MHVRLDSPGKGATDLHAGLRCALASLMAICIHTGTLWPWGVVVHEDGRRTLAETVFYF